MLKQAGVLIFVPPKNNREARLQHVKEYIQYDLKSEEDVSTVFWSHRNKSFIIVSTHDLHSKPFYKGLNRALTAFFKSNQLVEQHLTNKLAPPKELVRYQVWNRQVEEMWKFVEEALRAWAN